MADKWNEVKHDGSKPFGVDPAKYCLFAQELSDHSESCGQCAAIAHALVDGAQAAGIKDLCEGLLHAAKHHDCGEADDCVVCRGRRKAWKIQGIE